MGLQFYTANYQTLLAKYDFNNYSRLVAFQDKLSPEDGTVPLPSNGGQVGGKNGPSGCMATDNCYEEGFWVAILLASK